MSTKKSTYIEKIMQSGEQMGIESVIFHSLAADKLGLNLSDMKAMSVLQRNGRLSASRLASLCDLTPGAITSLVNRLTVQGFVDRVQDDRDARRVLIQLNTARINDIQTLYGPMISHMSELLAHHNNEELRIIADYQESVVKLMQEEATALQLER